MRTRGFARAWRRKIFGQESGKVSASGASAGMMALALAGALLVLGGCGAGANQPPPPHDSGGIYTSSAYHFRVSYPDGWAANTGDGAQNCFHDSRCQAASSTTASQVNPLTLVITRATSSGGPLVSNLTVSVLNLSDASIAKSAQALPSTKSLHKTTLSGLTAYADNPTQQQAPSAQPGASAVTDTHQDYYLVHGSYEYQISTDAISTDGADSTLAGMLRSFTILS